MWAVVEYTFNLSTPKAEAGRSVSCTTARGVTQEKLCLKEQPQTKQINKDTITM